MNPFVGTILVILFTTLLVVTVRYGSPLLIRGFFPQFVVTSISPRSIRGLRWRVGSLQLSIERIGFGLHKPTADRKSWLSIQVEQFNLRLLNKGVRGRGRGSGAGSPWSEGGKGLSEDEEGEVPQGSSLVRLLDADQEYAPPLAFLSFFLPTSAIRSIDHYLRPFFRVLLVYFLRQVFRTLPAVTQLIQFEMDLATIASEDLHGAGFTITDVRVHTLVELKQFEEAGDDDVEEERPHAVNMRIGASRLKTRMRGAMSRLWNRAWGKAQGLTSLTVSVGSLKAFCGEGTLSRGAPSPSVRSPSVRSMQGVTLESPVTSSSDFTEDLSFSAPYARYPTPPSSPDPLSPLPNEIILLIKEALTVRMSLRLEPRKAIIGEGSVNVDVDIPPSTISLGAVRGLLALLTTPRTADTPSQPQSPAEENEAPEVWHWSAGLRKSISPASAPLRSLMRMAKGNRLLRSHSVDQQKDIGKRLAQLINYLNVRLRTVDVSLDLSPHGTEDDLSLQICDMHLRAERSDSERNELHRSWFGRQTDKRDPSDPHALALSILCESLTVDRVSARLPPVPPTSLLSVHGLIAEGLTTWAPAGLLSAASPFMQDENSAVIICHVTLESVEMQERIDTLKQTLLLFTPSKRNKPSRSHSEVYSIPRVVAGIEVKNISLQVRLPSEHSPDAHPAFMDMFTAGISLHAHTSYVDLCGVSRKYEPGKAYWGGEDGRRLSEGENYNLRYIFSLAGSAEPFTSKLRYALSENHVQQSPDGLRRPSNSTAGKELSFIACTGFEVAAHGHTLGTASSLCDAKYTSLDVFSTMADVRATVAEVVVEAWNPDVLRAIASFAALKAVRVSEPSPLAPAILDRLPTGVYIYMSVCSLTTLVAGEDPTGSHAKKTSRGVAVRVGFVLQYCYYQALRHNIRAKKRLGHTLARQRLAVPEDLSVQASAFANDVDHPDELAALASLTGWNFSARSSMNAEKDAERYAKNGHAPLSFHLGDNLICSVPHSVTRILLQRQRSNTVTAHRDSCSIMLEIPSVSAELRLQDLFCALLATKSFTSTLSPSPAPRLRKKSPVSRVLSVNMRATIENMDVECYLCSKGRFYLRAARLSPEWGSDGTIVVRMAILYVWIPSPSVEGKWEELLRLRDWNASVFPDEATKPTVVISGKGARIHIPYNFILSRLISDFNVSLKAARHLVFCIRTGSFDSPPLPKAQGPRNVPHVQIRLDTLTMEAIDAPFESRLNLIYKAGYQEQIARSERDLAFEAKVEAISGGSDGSSPRTPSSIRGIDWRFSEKHTVPIADAHGRLQQYNSMAWIQKHRAAKSEQERKEDIAHKSIHGTPFHFGPPRMPINIYSPEKAPPLFRIVLSGLKIAVSQPSFPASMLPSFLHDLGRGVPVDQQYTLLVPMGIIWEMDAARITLRDYPLPLIHVPTNPAGGEPAWCLKSDFAVAEQVGPPTSLQWITAEIMPKSDTDDMSSLSFLIPKTCMPIKTFAEPQIRINTSSITEFAWGVSYNAVIQDVMRVVESITSPQRDPSPTVGFWDKLRLVFHWRVKWNFVNGGVHFHIKGSRDPYQVSDIGAGFALCWQGSPSIQMGYADPEMELIQVQSERMLFVIPNLEHLNVGTGTLDDDVRSKRSGDDERKYRKICAKFTNGVRWGIGFKLERTCRPNECDRCKGSVFHRQCRIFEFRPHFTVTLAGPPGSPKPSEGYSDSYAGFRSDFVHMNMSLTSPTRETAIHGTARVNTAGLMGYNSIHLSPKGFAHFWSWWRLFDGAMSLPIRQGKLFPSLRPPSKKFGKHLATVKYRFSLAPLVISHIYKQDSKSGWAKGQTKAVGFKAMIDKFQADMHQRLQEIITYHEKLGKTKRTARKKFGVADVTASGVDLRALTALFAEPEKATVSVSLDSDSSEDADVMPAFVCDELEPGWFDLDDFVDTDWVPSDHKPKIRLLQAGACPRFSFFKHAHARAMNRRGSDAPTSGEVEVTKFGGEDTHICLVGKNDDVYQVQMKLSTDRLHEVEHELAEHLAKRRVSAGHASHNGVNGAAADRSIYVEREADLRMKVRILSEYLGRLRVAQEHASKTGGVNHLFFENGPALSQDPSALEGDAASAEDWANFDNVYEAHFPTIFLSNDTRNVLLDYYYSSRNHRGLEYHLTQRAIKFIRDHAKPVDVHPPPAQTKQYSLPNSKQYSQPNTPVLTSGNRMQGAAQGLFRLFTHDERSAENEDLSKPVITETDEIFDDPHSGWSDEVTVRKSHFARLLKPQIVLRSDLDRDSIAVLAIRSVHIRNFSVLDKEHLDDPVNGRIMQRNYVSLNGLQVFYPARGHTGSMSSFHNFVPLEVLLDVRAETRDFDRLVPYTDVKMHYDKFNQLRLRKNMRTYSGSVEGLTKRNEHLKHNMDRITVGIPNFSVAADARHFGAVFNIVTDLMLYRDPAQQARSQKLETFIYSYDFTDLHSATDVVARLQRRMRHLMELEKNHTLRSMDDVVQHDSLAVRAEMQSIAEELSFIFDAIKVKQDKMGNRKDDDANSALRLETYVNEISWRMLDAKHALLAKLSAKGIAFSWLSRKDGSAASRLDLDDLQVLNTTPDALFPEILVKYEKSSYHPSAKTAKFARASWSMLAPVAGISVIQSFELQLHPVRMQVERRVGRQIMDYVFSQRHARKDSPLYIHPSGSQSSGSPDPPNGTARRQTLQPSNGSYTTADSARVPEESTSSRDYRPRLLGPRSSSLTDVRGASVGLRGRPALSRTQSSDALRPTDAGENKDAAEMRSRAAANRTFLFIKVESSVFVLSYKGDKPKSITDLYDFKFQVPSFQYRNQTWSFENLVQQLKKDIIKSAWQQKGALFREVVTKTRRPQHILHSDLRHDSSPSSTSELVDSLQDLGKKVRKGRLWPLRLRKGSSRKGSTASELSESGSASASGSIVDPAVPLSSSPTEESGNWTYEEPGRLGRQGSESTNDSSELDFPIEDSEPDRRASLELPRENEERPRGRRVASDFPRTNP